MGFYNNLKIIILFVVHRLTKKYNHKIVCFSSFLLRQIRLAAVATLLSAALVVVPIQEANAQTTSFTFTQNQKNKCSRSAGCSNSATITIIIARHPPPHHVLIVMEDKTFKFKQIISEEEAYVLQFISFFMLLLVISNSITHYAAAF
jgi:hypothetical protein